MGILCIRITASAHTRIYFFFPLCYTVTRPIMTGRAKQLEVNTTETRTPSEFSLAFGVLPRRELPRRRTFQPRRNSYRSESKQ